MRVRFPAALTAIVLLLLVAPAAGAQDDIKRMPDGRPDLHGNYDAATLTPLQRPEEYGEIHGTRVHRDADGNVIDETRYVNGEEWPDP